jgi:hypothetical protein
MSKKRWRASSQLDFSQSEPNIQHNRGAFMPPFAACAKLNLLRISCTKINKLTATLQERELPPMLTLAKKGLHFRS